MALSTGKIPFLDNTPVVDGPKQKTVLTPSETVTALGLVSSPSYINPDVFVAHPLSKNLNRYVRPNPVRKLFDAWLDLGWCWEYDEYKDVAGVPIRDQVIKVALIKKQPILCRVKGHKKHVFIIGPEYARQVADELKSYQTIYGSEFLIIPIVKFKKVAYS